jgi:hypothetical protein
MTHNLGLSKCSSSTLFLHHLTKGSFARCSALELITGSSIDRPCRGGGFSQPPFGFLCLSLPLRNHKGSHALSLPLWLLRLCPV